VALNESGIKLLRQGDKSIPELTVLAESLHAKVEENKLNPYGEVTGGTLTMKGAIRPARAQRCDIGSEEYFFSLNLLDDVSGEVIGRADFDETVWPTEKFWCVPITYIPSLDWAFGLLLADKTQEMYVRIGRFNSQRHELLDKCDRRTITVI
jgi:hypothetical protein